MLAEGSVEDGRSIHLEVAFLNEVHLLRTPGTLIWEEKLYTRNNFYNY